VSPASRDERSDRAGPAVAFDATGTLIETAEPVGEVYRRVALTHGVDLPAWRLDDAFRRVLRRAPPRSAPGDEPSERARSEIAWWHDLVRQTFQATDSTVRFADRTAFANDLFETYRRADAWRPRPGARSLLSALHAEGARLALVSNFDHRLPDILEALDLAPFFEVLAIPARTGLSKPDPALFGLVAERLGVPLEALSYVGDDPKETLAQIARLGVRVVDVRAVARLDDLLDVLLARTRQEPS